MSFISDLSTRKWPVVQLADVAERCLGKMLDAKKNKGRMLPYLANPNVRWFDVDTSNLKMMPFEPHEDERYGLRRGDIVICEGGEAGRAAIWDGRLVNVKFQKAIHRVRPGPRLDSRYFVHRIMADYQSGRLADYYTGATIKHLTGQDLARYRFPLPPLSEQRRIAAILDQADALRAKRREVLTLLDELQQGIFIEMFGDPAHNTRGLPLIALGEAGTWQSGGTPPRTQEHYFNGEIPWFSSGELESMYVRESIERISSDAVEETSAKLVKKGSLMLGMYDTAALKASISGVDCSCNQAIAFSKLENGVLDVVYAYHAVVIGREHFRRLQRGVRQKNLNLSMIRGIEIPFPAIESQREFARRTSLVTNLRISLSRSLAELDSLFHSLQYRAFRGEL